MINQVAVYDDSGAQVGMTFPKRAKQLVSKQRAVWQDDEHRSIKLLADTIEGDTTAPSPEESDDLLLYLARKNVREKRNILRHTAAFIVALTILIFFYTNFGNTLHPSHNSLMSTSNRLETALTGHVNPTAIRPVEDAINWLQTIATTYSSPIWYLVFGAVLTWGGWIAIQYSKRAIRHFGLRRGPKPKKVKVDPVALEYQRLKNLATDGVPVARC